MRYSIEEIFFLTIVAVICGCDSWEGIDLFGQMKLAWFRQYFPYKKRTPSADALRNFYAKLDGAAFGQCFISWANEHFVKLDGEVISLDGKRLRGSFDTYHEQQALHVVSAYAAGNELTLGQVLTHEKSNEITAIPQLLELIDVKGATVSIDAMGCRTDIASLVRKKEGIICWP